MNVAPGPSVTPAASPNVCVRAGCNKPAVESKDWDEEYCSNECVATHCRCVCSGGLEIMPHTHQTRCVWEHL